MEPRRPLPTPECAPVRELLAAAIDAPLTGAERDRASAHLATCRACRMFETELALDASAMMRLRAYETPERVGRRIRATPRSRSGNGPALVLAVAGFALFVFVTGDWFRGTVGPGATGSPPGPSTAVLPTTAPPTSTVAPTDPATPSSRPGPTVGPTASVFPELTGRLTRIDAPSLAGDAAIWGVVPWRDGAVAVGRRCLPPPGGERQCVAAAWVVDDLATGTWQEQTPAPASPNADGVAIVGLAATAERLVAVGHARLGEDLVPLIWTSPDGVTWTRVDAPGGVVRGWVTSVAAGAAGFVAVGTEVRLDAGLATAWHSTDGVTWTLETARGLDGGVRATTPLAPDSRRLEFGGMQDVVLFADGRAVGVGARCRPDGDPCLPRVWLRSGDGTWTALTVAEGTGELTAVTTVGERVLAVGGDRDGRPIAFVSDDLVTWDRLAIATDAARPGGFTEVAGIGTGAIAFSSDGTAMGVWRWTPADGWLRVGDDGPASRTVFGSGVVDGRLVVAGRRPDGAALWTADEVAR